MKYQTSKSYSSVLPSSRSSLASALLSTPSGQGSAPDRGDPGNDPAFIRQESDAGAEAEAERIQRLSDWRRMLDRSGAENGSLTRQGMEGRLRVGKKPCLLI